jgi:hypothetical protein
MLKAISEDIGTERDVARIWQSRFLTRYDPAMKGKLLMSIKSVFQRILGIPQNSNVEAVRRQQATETPMYLPAHRLTATELAGGVGSDGSCWELWRVEHGSGLRWFKRISGHSTVDASVIHGFDSGAPADPDDELSFDESLLEPATNAVDAVRNFHLRQAARGVARRMNAFPIDTDSHGEIDSDES